MSPSSRRQAAVLGGNRIPFARRERPVRARLEPGHVHRPRSTGSSAASACRASASARSRPAGCSSTATTSTSPASACSAARSTRRRPPTTSSRPAARASQTTIHVANKIALGQIECGIAGGVDTTSDAPIEVNEDLRRLLLGPQPREVGRRERLGAARAGCARARSCRGSRATRSRAPACRWASTRRSRPGAGGSRAHEQDEWAVASHRKLAAAYERGFFDDLVTPYLGLERDQNLRPDSDRREAREAQAGVRRRRPGRDDDRGQLDAALRRRRGRAAGQRRVGGGELAAGARPHRRRRDRRRRLRPRRRGPARRAAVRRAAPARPQRADACRTSTSTRSTRRSPRRC